jgi:hypothetical protein
MLLAGVSITHQSCGELSLFEILFVAGSPDHDAVGATPGKLLHGPENGQSPTCADAGAAGHLEDDIACVEDVGDASKHLVPSGYWSAGHGGVQDVDQIGTICPDIS